MEPLRCENCGREMQGYRSDARTCSNACRQALHRKRRPTSSPGACAECGLPIEPTAYHVDDSFQVVGRRRRSDAIYCDAACRQAAYRRREDTIGPEASAALRDLIAGLPSENAKPPPS